MKRYPAILGKLYNTPHAILPGKLEEIAAFIESVRTGAPRERVVVEAPVAFGLSAAGDEVAYSRLEAAPAAGDAFVAVLPLFGSMMQHGSLEMEYSGGTSTEDLGRDFMRLIANASVKTIVIHVHSPGGQIWGTGELADLIFANRGAKRIVTIANSEMASAALWVGTAAHEAYVTPGGSAGSVGVVTMHRDFSKQEEMDGLKTTLIATPAKKIAGHPFAPLPDDVAAELLANCEKSLERFVVGLARNRGLKPDQVRSDFGGGGMLRAEEAVTAKMCDGVATLREILEGEVEQLRSGGRSNSQAANRRAISLAEAEQ